MSKESTGAVDFSVTMPLVKVWQDDAGELWFEGVASSTSLDRQQERMTANAIRKMGEQRGIELLPSHSAGPIEELGVVEETWVSNDQFRVAGRLDKSNQTAVRLFDRIAAGRAYGLSVGGRVRKAYWAYDDEAGRMVRHIDDVELDHVAVCRPETAANPDTYLSVMAKAAESLAPAEASGSNETSDGDDLLVRIGKAAVDAARHIWPFGRSAEAKDEAAGEAAEIAALAELGELRKQLEEVLAEARKTLGELSERSRGEPAAAEAKRGQTQSLEGQETVASAMADPWRRVL